MKEFDGYRGSNRISSVLTLCLPGRYAIRTNLQLWGAPKRLSSVDLKMLLEFVLPSGRINQLKIHEMNSQN
jgi:hypothetical protein